MTSLSVLMPARNAEQHIDAAVRSTLAAMPRDSEILVLDDASDDSTSQVIQGIRDSRLRLIRSERRNGVAGGLNLLLHESRGGLVARMDADDVTLPWRFRLTRRLAEQGFVTFGSSLVFGGTRRLQRPRLVRSMQRHDLGLRLLRNNFLTHPSLLVQRDVLLSNGGYYDCGAEDYELWLRLFAANYQFGLVRTPVVLYRQHPEQVTRTSTRTRRLEDPRLLAAWLQVAEQVLPNVPDQARHASSVEELRQSFFLN